MPTVRMPTGEMVEMPDNPTPDQLSALEEINKNAPSPLSQKLNQYVIPGTNMPLVSSRGMLADAEHGTKLALHAGLQGLTSTAGLLADLPAQGYNAITGKNIRTPSQNVNAYLDKTLDTPQNNAERLGMFGIQLMAGSKDPIMSGITSKIMGPKPLYNAPPPPTAASVKADTINEARQAGLTIPPSMAQGSLPARITEDLAGKTQIQKMANAKNVDALNAIATKEAGLPAGTPLTRETLNNAIASTYKQGYDPIAKLGTITTGGKYRKALDAALEDYNQIEKSFPGTAPSEIPDIINSYRVKAFDGKAVVPTLRQLRDDASAAYNAGKPEVGRAYKSVANAIEDAIDLNAAKRAPDLIKDFRAARTAIAKQSTVRDAVIEGSGNINPATIGAMFGKHPERYTDGLATIGKFAKTFPQLARPNAPPPSLFTNPEIGMMGGSPLTAMLAGNPIGVASAGVPLARLGTRQALLSPFMQSHMALSAASQTPGWLSQAAQNPNVINTIPTLEQMLQNGMFSGGGNGQ